MGCQRSAMQHKFKLHKILSGQVTKKPWDTKKWLHVAKSKVSLIGSHWSNHQENGFKIRNADSTLLDLFWTRYWAFWICSTVPSIVSRRSMAPAGGTKAWIWALDSFLKSFKAKQRCPSTADTSCNHTCITQSSASQQNSSQTTASELTRSGHD